MPQTQTAFFPLSLDAVEKKKAELVFTYSDTHTYGKDHWKCHERSREIVGPLFEYIYTWVFPCDPKAIFMYTHITMHEIQRDDKRSPAIGNEIGRWQHEVCHEEDKVSVIKVSNAIVDPRA